MDSCRFCGRTRCAFPAELGGGHSERSPPFTHLLADCPCRSAGSPVRSAVGRVLGSRDNPALTTTILCWSVSSQVSEQQRPGVPVCECVCVMHTRACAYTFQSPARGQASWPASAWWLWAQAPASPLVLFFSCQLLCPQRGVDEEMGLAHGAGGRAGPPTPWPPDSLVPRPAAGQTHHTETQTLTVRPQHPHLRPQGKGTAPAAPRAETRPPRSAEGGTCLPPPVFRWSELPPRKTPH